MIGPIITGKICDSLSCRAINLVKLVKLFGHSDEAWLVIVCVASAFATLSVDLSRFFSS